jgi:phage/plasmid-like protein (TIGR03299 family)
MAHNVTERDGMFVVRQASWHGLEDEVFPDYPTREVAQKIAHNWEPVTEPVFRRVPTINADGSLTVEYQEIAGFNANVRSDTGHTLGVVTDSYEPVLNDTMWDIAEAIEGIDKGSVKYETGGSLKGGAKVWLLLRLAEPLIIKGDPNGAVLPYFALQNAHDGSGAFRGQSLLTRIVCDNTAQAADYEAQARGTEFAFSHTKNVMDRIEEARAAVAGWRHSIQEWQLLSEHFVNSPITAAQRVEFIDTFVPMPQANLTSDRVVNNVLEARAVIGNILDGPTCEGINDTAYGLVQASIEYANHYRRANSAQTRFKRAYLDRSQITADASKIVRDLIAV